MYRNQEVFRVVEHVLNAVGSAGDFLTMYFHMLIVISALTTVLLHGQLSTRDNEYDIDSQFKDFYYSMSTMTIYLIGPLLQSVWQVLSMIVGRWQFCGSCHASP